MLQWMSDPVKVWDCVCERFHFFGQEDSTVTASIPPPVNADHTVIHFTD